MKRFLSISLALVTLVCALAASERRAWGYVDPGQGLLVLQGFASVMAAAGFYMRRRILALFGRKKDDGKQLAPAVRRRPNATLRSKTSSLRAD